MATPWYKSDAFKVFMLAVVGVAVMMSIAMSLAFTLGAPKPFSPILYTSIITPSFTVESTAKPCSSQELGACPTVLEYGTSLDSLTVSATVPANLTEGLEESLGAYATPTAVTFQVCYADAFVEGRPWRAPKDAIGRDKQCGISACKSVPLQEGTGARTATCDYTVGDDLGTAVYYFRALGENDKGDYVVGNTAKDQYFQINTYNGRTTSIIAGVVACSVFAWGILIGGLIYEYVMVKKQE
mmetsp:Transcript_6541/g.16886  ORF Transcript_6541/g.16886 Transcript_6541/m.16886 type:complete len:241 (-) Transcript_6541:999-1721(-)